MLSEDITSKPKRFISTQHPLIDMTIGHPGIPCGRVCSFFGHSSTGKTTICYHILAETQRLGGVAILIDAEYALDPDRAAAIGIDCASLIVLEPDTLDECITYIEEVVKYVREEDPDCLVTIVLDSVAGISTQAEEDDKGGIGGHARVMSRGLRRITKKISNLDIALVIVNQYKDKIDAMAFAEKTAMIAEKPIRFHSTIGMEVAQVTKIPDPKTKEIIGITSRARNKKNKIAAPFREATFEVSFANPGGINIIEGFFQLGLQTGVIVKKGSRYALDIEGKESKTFYQKEFTRVLRDNPDLLGILHSKLPAGFVYPPESRMWHILDDVVDDEIDEDMEMDEAA